MTVRVVTDFGRAFPGQLSPLLRQLRPHVGKLENVTGENTVIHVDGERVLIPRRINGRVPNLPSESDPVAPLIISCLMSRHSDGRIRESHLRKLLGRGETWIAPFVLMLVGEYVIEIVELIRAAVERGGEVGGQANSTYAKLLRENPDFTQRLYSQCVSYWNAYYRGAYPDLSEYPGRRVLDAILGVRP
jgi:hypothetical protein